MLPQFPMSRLLMLLARQVTTPVAGRIKEYATANEWFKRHVCMAVGRSYHVMQLRVRMWSLALPQPAVLPPITDSAALQSGATLLGEIIVFGLGSLIILFEMNRQGNIQQNKELDAESQWVAILMQLQELQRELDLQQGDIERLIAELRRRAPSKFPAPPEHTGPLPTPSSRPSP